MAQVSALVNPDPPPAPAPAPQGRRYAPLRNMTALAEAVDAALGAPRDLPRIVCLSGWSGLGKSYAAGYVAAQYRCAYVEARDFWSRRRMIMDISLRVGIDKPRGTIADMAEAAGRRLAAEGMPLIIDEADFLVAHNLVELVRSLHDMTRVPIVLIGMEGLPQALQRWEQAHNRVGWWVQAQPCDLTDARALAALYAPGVTVADDLLADLIARVHGVTRRIAVNLHALRAWARGEGKRAVGLAEWGDRAWSTGEAPAARARGLAGA